MDKVKLAEALAKLAGSLLGPGIPDGTGPMSGMPCCLMNKDEEDGFLDIADEENVHDDESQTVLNCLESEETNWLDNGDEEVDEMVVASKLVKLAKEIVSKKSYALLKDVKTKNDSFDKGEMLSVVKYNNSFPYSVTLETNDGRKLSTRDERAYKILKGFPKPPSIRTMEKWMDDGVARAVDGARVEPDGVSPDGAPSWISVIGF